jgi:hypothetical protein
MAVRVLVAALVSAVLMFVWGFVFWAVLGMGARLMDPLPAAVDVIAPLRHAQTPSGMYIFPMPADMNIEGAQEEFERLHEEGPLLQLAFVAEGRPAMPPSMYAMGLGHYFAVALLTGCLVAFTVKGMPSFGTRLAFVLLVSLIAVVWSNGGDWVWWFHSPKYCLGNAAYSLVAGLLMSLTMAAVIKPVEAGR